MYIKIITILIFCCILIGCTFFNKNRNVTQDKIDKAQQAQIESAAFWNHLANYSLKLNTNHNQFTDLAIRATDNNINILGIPAIADQVEIKKLLPTDTKLSVKQIVEKQLVENKLNKREAADSKAQQDLAVLREENRVLTERLVAYGQIYEKQQNANIVKRVWRWGIATFGIGGMIALCVFFPALIPIFLAIFKWVFSKFVIFIQWLVPAFTRTVQGIANTKKVLATEAEINKSLPADKKILYTPEEASELISEELGKAQNAEDKEVISKVKEKLNV